jgi:hypothetical protein
MAEAVTLKKRRVSSSALGATCSPAGEHFLALPCRDFKGRPVHQMSTCDELHHVAGILQCLRLWDDFVTLVEPTPAFIPCCPEAWGGPLLTAGKPLPSCTTFTGQLHSLKSTAKSGRHWKRFRGLPEMFSEWLWGKGQLAGAGTAEWFPGTAVPTSPFGTYSGLDKRWQLLLPGSPFFNFSSAWGRSGAGWHQECLLNEWLWAHLLHSMLEWTLIHVWTLSVWALPEVTAGQASWAWDLCSDKGSHT